MRIGLLECWLNSRMCFSPNLQGVDFRSFSMREDQLMLFFGISIITRMSHTNNDLIIDRLIMLINLLLKILLKDVLV